LQNSIDVSSGDPAYCSSPTMMHGYGRVDHVASQRTEPRKRAVLVHARQTAEPDDISRKDRCYLALAMF
jgi:hypothetical protein